MLSLELQLFKQDEEQSLMYTRTQTAYRAKASVESCQVSAYKHTYNVIIGEKVRVFYAIKCKNFIVI